MMTGWSPDPRVFRRRAALAALATFVLTLVLLLPFRATFAAFPPLIALLPLAVAAIFVIEDYGRWRGMRGDRWSIEDDHLVHDGAEGRALVHLGEIATVTPRPMGTLLVRLHSGQRIAMRHLSDPRGVARAIAAAR